uniref:Ig-like domain-containing protein n=1 Tax=Terrapene triunguis TaxID=2587831 RepID=A0A674J0Z4_9SAUR
MQPYPLLTSLSLKQEPLLLTIPAVLGESIQSNKPEVSSGEGDNVTLSCSYNTSYSDVYLYWYRQFPGQGPQYSNAEQNGVGRRFSAEFRKSSKFFSLTIKELEPTDSAMYFCALWGDTVRRLIGSPPVSCVCYAFPEPLPLLLGCSRINLSQSLREVAFKFFSQRPLSLSGCRCLSTMETRFIFSLWVFSQLGNRALGFWKKRHGIRLPTPILPRTRTLILTLTRIRTSLLSLTLIFALTLIGLKLGA